MKHSNPEPLLGMKRPPPPPNPPPIRYITEGVGIGNICLWCGRDKDNSDAHAWLRCLVSRVA